MAANSLYTWHDLTKVEPAMDKRKQCEMAALDGNCSEKYYTRPYNMFGK